MTSQQRIRLAPFATLISAVQKTRVDLLSEGFTSLCHNSMKVNDFPLAKYDDGNYAIRVKRRCCSPAVNGLACSAHIAYSVAKRLVCGFLTDTPPKSASLRSAFDSWIGFTRASLAASESMRACWTVPRAVPILMLQGSRCPSRWTRDSDCVHCRTACGGSM